MTAKPPKVETLWIEKEEAQEWLLKIPNFQRKVNNKILQYQRDMDGGRWHHFVVLVAFDTRDALINSQHVLTAFLRSKLDRLGVIVARGYPSEAYKGFDKNRTRSAADDLRTMGYERATELAGAGKILWQYHAGVFNGKGWMAARSAEKIPTPAESIEMVEKFPGLAKHLIKNPCPGTGLALVELRAVSYLIYQRDEAKAEKFMESLIEGIGIPSKQHPIAIVLKSIRESRDGQRWRHGETMARLLKAWKAYVGDCQDATFRKGEVFPIPSFEAAPAVAKKGAERVQ